MTAPADFGGKVSAVVKAVTPMSAQAMGPGEIAGPALALTIQIHNGTDRQIDLGSTTVNLTDSTGAPGIAMTDDPAQPISGALAAGSTASGVYVFRTATKNRSPITVSVRYSTEAPVVLFVGDAK